MQVLLCQDVDNLGREGELVDVAPGYARNYLLPKKIAVPVNPDSLRQAEAAREARRRREEEELERVGRQAGMLDGFLCFITARATEKGHLFGSVGPQQVADELVASGFEGIRPANVSLDRHIEEVGDYEVEVMLHPEVRVNILVRVAAEQEEEE
jgi:large subunit ribosomal protein L9